MKVLVNGVSVPIIENERELRLKLRGIPAGSILIVKYDCYYSFQWDEYATARDVKIVRQK